jgi:hypothetical protein
MKLPPLKNPRVVLVPVVADEDDLFVVELLLTLLDWVGALLNDLLPELKERALASALSAGIVTTIVKANKLNNNNAFFHMGFQFLLLGCVC